MRGLKWLAAHQQSDGSWSLKDYAKGIAGCDCQSDFEKEAEDSLTAGTAFGVLPFLGAGVTHNRAPAKPPELAKYQKVVERGLIFLAQHQIRGKQQGRQEGRLSGRQHVCPRPGHDRALRGLWSVRRTSALRVNAQLAIKYLLNAQHEQGGGWRYGPGSGRRHVGHGLGLPGDPQRPADRNRRPEATLGPRGAVRRFLRRRAPGGQELTLRLHARGRRRSSSLSAAGLLTRQYLGWKKDEPDLLAGAQYLMQNLPPESGANLGAIYYYYYATQVLHHLEGPNFDLWNHRMREHLIRTQEKTGHKTGSWNPEGTDLGARGGRMYSTSMALLTLQVYYRHLPMYRFVKLGGGQSATVESSIQ